MESFEGQLIAPEASVREAIAALEACPIKFLLVVDENGRLIGTLTDGDIRRGLINGDLRQPVSQVMHTWPTVARLGDDPAHIAALLAHPSIRYVPLLDADDRPVAIRSREEKIGSHEPRPETVLIMAGGEGARLRPLTLDLPKPLLPVAGRPILEWIIDHCVDYGLTRFVISVRYKSGHIRAFLGDGSAKDVQVAYVDETEPLGTAGALGLLDPVPEHPIIVMNGDILTKLNFDHLLEFHHREGGHATVCVRSYEATIPFGVVLANGHEVSAIVEKPSYSYNVSAGIYVLSPEVLAHVPRNRALDMPDLLSSLLKHGQRVVPFPIHEYWTDVGRMDDFVGADAEFRKSAK